MRTVEPIAPGSRPAANPEQVNHEPARVAHHVHGRARRVTHRDRDLLQHETVLLDHDEDLDVEAEAVDLDPLEQLPTDAGFEGFQPALRVAVVTEQHDASQQVDHPAADLAYSSSTYEIGRAVV